LPGTLPSWDEYASLWTRLHGGVDPRRARPTVRSWLYFGYLTARFLARMRIRPGAVTVVGLLASVLVPVFAVRGPTALLLAALMVMVAAVADTADGALAVITDHTTRLGYVYDSVVDRLGELIWLVAFWLIGVPAYAVVIAGTLTWMHEYVRSRANAAGMTEIGGSTLGERPTRVVLAIVGLGLAGLVGLGNPDIGIGVATFAVAAWIVLSVIGFLQLFATVHRVLGGRKWPPWSVPARPGSGGERPTDRPTAGPRTDTGPGYAPGAGFSRHIGYNRDVAYSQDALYAGGPRPVAEPSAEAFAEIEESRGFRTESMLDEDLLREIAELGELPGSSAVYTSTATGGDVVVGADAAGPDGDLHGRHALVDEGEPEGSPA
jgi:phosphatidylglycerophosphate synthase